MDGLYQRDQNRILLRTTTGGVQAWKPDNGDISVVASFDLTPSRGGNGHANFSQFMTTTDARSLAAALVKAADHADALAVVTVSEAA